MEIRLDAYEIISKSHIISTVSIKDTKKGVLFMARKKKEIKDTKKELETPIEDIETMDEVEIPVEKENIEIMSLDNKPINKEVMKEPVNIPDKFVKIPKRIEHTKTINVRNGRVYKELGNGYGVYSDDGSIFKLQEDYMEFIKLGKGKYLIKGSNSLVVSEEEKLKLEKRE